jgi:transcriptional regulator with XRE-family HTH domain
MSWADIENDYVDAEVPIRDLPPDAGPIAKERAKVAIRRARVMSGLDQTSFGRRIAEAQERAPYSRATVANWERGESDPHLVDLLIAAQLAGVAVGVLLQPGELEAVVYQHQQKLEEIGRLHVEVEQLRKELREHYRLQH